MLSEAAPLIGKAEYVSLVGVLLAGIAVLWRSVTKKDDQLQAVSEKMLQHTAALNQIPAALDRLRTEVIDKLDDVRDGRS